MSEGKPLIAEIDAVCGLLQDQFPQWASLPLSKFDSSGTDNSIYRLGEQMAVRLPRTAAAAGQLLKEQYWLPAWPDLPISTPSVLGFGKPAPDFPYAWTIANWFEGADAASGGIADWICAAQDLARFVCALQKMEGFGFPAAGKQNAGRGLALAALDALVCQSVAELSDLFDPSELKEIWQAALAVPPWTGKPVWLHGDIHAGNIIVNEGRISAIIDFGLMGAGDPACDLALAWSFLPAEVRDLFREATGVDEATWRRGKGWGLYIGVIALSYYRNLNPLLAAVAKQSIDAVLADFRGDPDC